MKFIVYSKPNCQYCVMAKNIINARGYNYREINLDVGQAKIDGSEYITRDELIEKIPDAKTMPQIFHGDIYIGGYSELKKLIDSP